MIFTRPCLGQSMETSSCENKVIRDNSDQMYVVSNQVQDDFKLQGDSGEVLISEWSGRLFDSCNEIFSLLDRRNKLVKWEVKSPSTAR